MLTAFNRIRDLDTRLHSLKVSGEILDYRIFLRINMNLELYIRSDKKLEDKYLHIPQDLEIELIWLKDEDMDSYYESVFGESESLNWGVRRSLNSILDVGEDCIDFASCPIVTFYSYKGGVGRTTALSLMASSYSMHHQKKVFIIDCDFEAPGLINFFGISNEDSPRNGIVEYIKDKEAGIDVRLRNEFVYEVESKYAGDGEIYVMPSGNIFEKKHREDYLEALARLDIHNPTKMVEHFRKVIQDINNEFSPDVILIDSRTGFNDIFGSLVNHLSDIIVGFFGNNSQNKPGLNFFIDTFLQRKNPIDLFFVLSIIPSAYSKQLKSFEQTVQEYINENIDDDTSFKGIPSYPVFGLSRNPSLENIGAVDDDGDDFISLTSRKMLIDYQELFDALSVSIESKNMNDTLEDDLELSESHTPSLSDLKRLKKDILDALIKDYPNAYAENQDFHEKDFFQTRFYLRKSMEDILNFDKTFLLGGKGTGKTTFYQALRNTSFVNTLTDRAQKKHLKFNIINIISLKNDPTGKRFIEVSANQKMSEIKDTDYFFRRFWLVYIWNVIRQEDQLTGYKSLNEVTTFDIEDNSRTFASFNKYIDDDEKYLMIEDDLHSLQKHLSKTDQYLIITFDRLDNIIKPIDWSKGISPLINLCLSNNFTRIQPKLFLRSDLFRNLGNLTNKEALGHKIINLEWTKDELYAFFFKVVFSRSQEDFFNYLRASKSFKDSLIKELKKKVNKQNSYKQLPAERYYLEPLVEAFFGEKQQSKGFGGMYDWIHRNLANADDTISLRPFLDLIRLALEQGEREIVLNQQDRPILHPDCFTYYVRENAVTKHFEDIAKEEGNEPLDIIIKAIKDNKVSRSLKISPIMQDELEELLKEIISKNKDAIGIYSLKELIDFLLQNGILSSKHMSGGRMKFTFAYLYKYFLGLRSPQKR